CGRARWCAGLRTLTPPRHDGVSAYLLRWACHVAAEARFGFYGRAPCRRLFTRRSRRPRAIESLSFRTVFQTVHRGTTTSILGGAPNRTRKGLARKSEQINYRNCI